MYKLLIFLKSSIDNKLLDHFKDITLPLLSQINDTQINLAKVESSLLLNDKYEYFCELESKSKLEMDKAMNSKAGKELMRDLAAYHQQIHFIFINYEGV